MHTRKEKRVPSPKEKSCKEIKEKQNSGERLRHVPEEKTQRYFENQSFLFFSCFLYIHGDVFDG